MPDNLIFRQLFDAASSTYTYLLGDARSQHAVLIDELGLKLNVALEIHCHADHVTGAWLMQQATGCRIGISARYGEQVQGADLRLDHGDRVLFGSAFLEVRATPGHTEGCLTYVSEDHRLAFTGDCLLIRSAGRCALCEAIPSSTAGGFRVHN